MKRNKKNLTNELFGWFLLIILMAMLSIVWDKNKDEIFPKPTVEQLKLQTEIVNSWREGK